MSDDVTPEVVDPRQRKIRRMNRDMFYKLALVVVLMSGFGYAMVPMYKVICETLGVNVLARGDAGVAYGEKPGAINYASAGNGTGQHLSMELFKLMTGINLAHVPYRGAAPAYTDVMSGQVPVFIDNLASALGQIKAGSVRALAVTSKPWQRMSTSPAEANNASSPARSNRCSSAMLSPCRPTVFSMWPKLIHTFG